MKTTTSVVSIAGLFLAVISAGIAAPPKSLLRPSAKLTPGAVLPVTTDDICAPGYSKGVPRITQPMKNKVFARYGILHPKNHVFEMDHLIPVELGGSNSIKNLWPQSYKTQPWNAHLKDKLENRLHSMVCNGEINLETAQHDIARNWIAAYKKYVSTKPAAKLAAKRAHSKLVAKRLAAKRLAVKRHKLLAHRSLRKTAFVTKITHRRTVRHLTPIVSQTTTRNPINNRKIHLHRMKPVIVADTISVEPVARNAGRVWVDPTTDKYYLPGSQLYGNTTEGSILSEADALALGYHRAK